MKILENKSGNYYTQSKESNIRNQVVSNKIYLAVNDSEDNWKEISKEEGEEIKQGQKILQDTNSVEALDNIIKSIKIIPVIINEIPMTDQEALVRKMYYPLWNKFIGKNLYKDFKVVYKDRLYKVRLNHTVQKLFFPSIDTASLYEEINEKAKGTKEDPIPYNNNMELKLGKFYSLNGIIYECIRDSGIALFLNLQDLVGIYVNINN